MHWFLSTYTIRLNRRHLRSAGRLWSIQACRNGLVKHFVMNTLKILAQRPARLSLSLNRNNVVESVFTIKPMKNWQRQSDRSIRTLKMLTLSKKLAGTPLGSASLERHEPYAEKLSNTVLRGECGLVNRLRLPKRLSSSAATRA